MQAATSQLQPPPPPQGHTGPRHRHVVLVIPSRAAQAEPGSLGPWADSLSQG